MNDQCEERSEHKEARDILHHALTKVLPEAALRQYVQIDETISRLRVAERDYNLHDYEKIFVVGGGKAARRTAIELLKILDDRITAGILNVYLDQAIQPISDRIRLFAADHPIPNEEGVKGAREMAKLLKSADEKTLIITLISGGGSSLMALPVRGVSLEDYRAISKLLLTVPATIDEINAVRKHLDVLKGGGLRKLAEHAGGFISLVLSDVPVTKTGITDDPSVIASGPTVGDGSTFERAKEILLEYKIWDKSPLAVRSYIEANLSKDENETLRKNSVLLTKDKNQYVIIANNDQAMEAARERAEQLGYEVILVGSGTGPTDDKIKGEVNQEAQRIWEIVMHCTTGNDRVTFASFSTDGIDGNSDVGGAIADGDTLKLGRTKGLDYQDYLARYDSATFFKRLGLAIETGPTGTNVADITLVLITNQNNPRRKIAFVFGGEPTVDIVLPEGQESGSGGRNTHLVLLAAERLAHLGKHVSNHKV